MYFAIVMAKFPDKRTRVCLFFRTLFRLRYKVTLVNTACLDQPGSKLVWPTHMAVIDPMLLFSELYNYPLQPFVDERFFANRIFRSILSVFDSISVPNLRKSRNGLEQAKKLNGLCYNALKEGKTVIFYPSGHCTSDGKESMGGRNMAHTIAQQLPSGTRIIGVKIRGLWGSCTSRYGRKGTPPIFPTMFTNAWKLFFPRRKVTMEFEDITDLVLSWQGMDKVEFNHHLEEYYNSKGIDEPKTK